MSGISLVKGGADNCKLADLGLGAFLGMLPLSRYLCDIVHRLTPMPNRAAG